MRYSLTSQPGISAKLVLWLTIAAAAIVVILGAMQKHAGELAIVRELEQSAAIVSKRLEVSLGQSVYEFNRYAIRDTVLAEFPNEDLQAEVVQSGRSG